MRPPVTLAWLNNGVVMPDSTKLPYWDVVMTFCLVWVAVLTPWETAFLELECVLNPGPDARLGSNTEEARDLLIDRMQARTLFVRAQKGVNTFISCNQQRN